MNLIKSAIAMLAFVAIPASAWAGDVGGTAAGEALAIRNCGWCHGPSGQGFSTAPRIAGQTTEYIELQFSSFRNHTRDNPKSKQFMWGAAAVTNPQVVHEIAVYLSMQPANAANDGDMRLAAGGQALYRDGSPKSNIPSCVACHGPNGEGIGRIPRLGGLSYHYLKRKLAQWGEGYHATAAAPMPGVATKLSPDEIEAVASHLSFVK